MDWENETDGIDAFIKEFVIQCMEKFFLEDHHQQPGHNPCLRLPELYKIYPALSPLPFHGKSLISI
jgi:hypothetical protein